VDVVNRFIECINHGDVEGLAALMTDDHELRVFDEDPVRGKEANRAAWRGYARAFPDYTIVSRAVAERDGRVAVLGHTTGSHLAPDAAERELTLIWIADVRNHLVRSWTLVEDTPDRRRELGLA
jgi:ketosteroid isomerase-like protein